MSNLITIYIDSWIPVTDITQEWDISLEKNKLSGLTPMELKQKLLKTTVTDSLDVFKVMGISFKEKEGFIKLTVLKY